MEKEISTDQAAKLDQIAPASKQAIMPVPAGEGPYWPRKKTPWRK